MARLSRREGWRRGGPSPATFFDAIATLAGEPKETIAFGFESDHGTSIAHERSQSGPFANDVLHADMRCVMDALDGESDSEVVGMNVAGLDWSFVGWRSEDFSSVGLEVEGLADVVMKSIPRGLRSEDSVNLSGECKRKFLLALASARITSRPWVWRKTAAERPVE